MAKVSIGLRGWRFDEEEIISADGELKPLDEIPEEPRERLVRLVGLVEEPCDVCYLDHGDAGIHRCAQAEIVYGEPGGEVLLCSAHEPDFIYWFREAGGSDHTGRQAFGDRFHEWVAAGNEAPDGYASVEHVEEDPAPDRSTPGVQVEGSGSAPAEPTDDAPSGWGDADFTTTDPDTFTRLESFLHEKGYDDFSISEGQDLVSACYQSS
jgi:hypothetical protein